MMLEVIYRGHVVILDISSTLDLAVLGLVLRRPQPLASLCPAVQALMAPWASPTVEVIEGRVTQLTGRGELAVAGDAVSATGSGRRAMIELMQRGMPEQYHALALAVEAVKLACLDLLDARLQAAVAADLAAARERCRLRLSARLASSDQHPPAVALGLRHQLRLLETGLEVLQLHLVPSVDRALVQA